MSFIEKIILEGEESIWNYLDDISVEQFIKDIQELKASVADKNIVKQIIKKLLTPKK